MYANAVFRSFGLPIACLLRGILLMTNSHRVAVMGALCLTASLQTQQVQCSLVVNSASFEPGLPEPGSLATVFCTGIRTVSGIVVAPTFLPLPQQLSGVSILINDSYVAPIPRDQ